VSLEWLTACSCCVRGRRAECFTGVVAPAVLAHVGGGKGVRVVQTGVVEAVEAVLATELATSSGGMLRWLAQLERAPCSDLEDAYGVQSF